MSTELDITNPAAAMNIAEKQQYAELLAQSSLLPKQYQRNPANVLLATELGQSLSIPPIQAINEVHVIEGKPSASANLIGGLVRRAGHILRIRTDREAMTATAQIIRRDDPDYTFETTWTMKDAERAGSTGKDNWKKYPIAMLKARAITEVAREACPEALMGISYTPDELGAVVDQDGNPVNVAAKAAPMPRQQSTPAQQEQDFYALLEQCQSRDDLNRVAGQISAAGRMNEYRGTLNELWKTLAPDSQQDEGEEVESTVVDEQTGEIHDNAA